MTASPHGRNVVTTKFEFAGREGTFLMFDTPLGRLACEEVLTGKSYPLVQFSGDVRTIVDIGAYVGAATIFFSLHFPAARILAFEPSPDSYRLLTRNTEGLANVTTFNLGLSDRDKSAPLYLGRHDSVTNSFGDSVLNAADSVPMELRDTKVVVQDQNLETIDILKLDTEGCEIPILRSLEKQIPRIGVIYVEYHYADDRLLIEQLLAPTHVLCRGTITSVHRGELCYVARDRNPDDASDNLGIRL